MATVRPRCQPPARRASVVHRVGSWQGQRSDILADQQQQAPRLVPSDEVATRPTKMPRAVPQDAGQIDFPRCRPNRRSRADLEKYSRALCRSPAIDNAPPWQRREHAHRGELAATTTCAPCPVRAAGPALLPAMDPRRRWDRPGAAQPGAPIAFRARLQGTGPPVLRATGAPGSRRRTSGR